MRRTSLSCYIWEGIVCCSFTLKDAMRDRITIDLRLRPIHTNDKRVPSLVMKYTTGIDAVPNKGGYVPTYKMNHKKFTIIKYAMTYISYLEVSEPETLM